MKYHNEYGTVGVDGSAESDAAVVWATHEAVVPCVPITLLHAVALVVVGWPVGHRVREYT